MAGPILNFPVTLTGVEHLEIIETQLFDALDEGQKLNFIFFDYNCWGDWIRFDILMDGAHPGIKLMLYPNALRNEIKYMLP